MTETFPSAEIVKKLSRIRELVAKYPEPWVIEKTPHNYEDGTNEFIHVRYRTRGGDDEVTVSIGEYLTPDLAELLVLLREVAPLISMQSR